MTSRWSSGSRHITLRVTRFMSTPAPAYSILVADDEEEIRHLLAHWLKSRGHLVETVGNLQEAMRFIRAARFDLLITDIVMPDGDGFELITAFRKAQPAGRIIAMSGGGQYLQGNDCLRIASGLGAHATVGKPFKWQSLESTIHQVMAIAQPGAV